MPGVKGKSGGARKGAGRKTRASEQELADLFDSSWPVAERLACIRRHARKAKTGDVKSFQLLMAYAYGKPVEHKQISGKDGEAIKVIVEYVGRTENT